MYIMIKFLSDFVIGYKLKKKLNSLAFVSKENLNQFKTMAVLIAQNHEIDDEIFLTLSRAFKIPYQNITIVVFSSKKKEELSTRIKNRMNFSRDDISFWGNVNQEFTSLFQQEFDLIVNYFDDKALIPSFVSAFCNAKVRLGFSNSNHALNDLMLTINPKETELFLSESTRYLKTILKKA